MRYIPFFTRRVRPALPAAPCAPVRPPAPGSARAPAPPRIEAARPRIPAPLPRPVPPRPAPAAPLPLPDAPLVAFVAAAYANPSPHTMRSLLQRLMAAAFPWPETEVGLSDVTVYRSLVFLVGELSHRHSTPE